MLHRARVDDDQILKPIYQINGLVPQDGYLPGQYRWPVPVNIASALLRCETLPVSGVLRVELEVGGVLSGLAFNVLSDQVLHQIELPVNASVPANTWVRWKVISDHESASLAITLTVIRNPAPYPDLTLEWFNATERLTLYDYSPATHLFTPTPQNEALTPSRLVVEDSAGVFTIAIQGTECLRVEGGALTVPFIKSGLGIASLTNPRVQFMVGKVPIATLTKTQLIVNGLTEDAPEALAQANPAFWERFEFYSDGLLTGALNLAGLVINAVDEV